MRAGEPDDWSRVTPDRKRRRVLIAMFREERRMTERVGSTAAAAARVTAQDMAHILGVVPARRAGRGAVKGSWSGYMAPGLRLAPTMRLLAEDGYLTCTYGHRSRREYRLSKKGRDYVRSVLAHG
jgi:hypothetical protein